MPLFDDLKSEAAENWSAYTDHEFIRQIETGTLPEAAFRNYLVQDYLFLIQFARAYALAAYKGHTVDDLVKGQRGLSAIIDETQLHVRLCSAWGLSREDLNQASEHASTVAYTRYVLDAGHRGDLLDLHVALSPCTVGYAEIGARLAPAVEAWPHHPYAEWIREYSSAEYQQLAAEAEDDINQLGERFLGTPESNPQRFATLVQIFATATRMETSFWQMGLDLGAAELSGTERNSGEF